MGQTVCRLGSYVQTRLSHDTADPTRYFTMDFWDSRQAHEQFRREHAREYEALDQACERLTLQETRLGNSTPAKGVWRDEVWEHAPSPVRHRSGVHRPQ